MKHVLRRLTICISLLMALSAVACARSVLLMWDDASNPPTAVTYNAYEANGSCATAANFSKINAAVVTQKTYTDADVGFGTRCYYVTAQATVDGETVESGPSNKAEAVVTPNSPSNLRLQLDPP